MKKVKFYTEVAYFLGLFLLAVGTALTVYGGFGVSMVVAPAFVLHKFASQFFPWFSFGVAEFVLQAFILLLMMLILLKAKVSYFLSFAAAIYYIAVLEGSKLLVGLLPENILYLQIILYVVGALICCAAIALLFNSYLPPEVYELFVKEIAAKLKKPIHKIKLIYDCGSLALAIILCIMLANPFKAGSFSGVIYTFMDYGIGIGTVVCAFVYGFIISLFQKLYLTLFEFKDGWHIKSFFIKGDNK